MRSDAPPLGFVAAGLVQDTRVDVVLGGRTVAYQIPVGSGRFVAQVDQDVPERVEVSLPREWEGVNLDPATGGALGSEGHRLHVTTTLSTPDGGGRWVVPVGRFLVHDWERDGASTRVMCDGLLRLVKDHQRAKAGGVSTLSPIRGEVMRLLAADGLEAYFDPALPNLDVPSGFTWGVDRFASLMELVTAWPARVRATPDGRIGFFPALPSALGVPSLWWHDGVGGTVVSAPLRGDREGVFNHVVVAVTADGVPEVTVEDRVRGGWLDPDTYGWVTLRVESDAITSRPQAEAVLGNELARAGVRGKTVPVEMAADWRAELDDVVEVKHSSGVQEWGRVTGLDLPLTMGDGAARADVGVVS